MEAMSFGEAREKLEAQRPKGKSVRIVMFAIFCVETKLWVAKDPNQRTTEIDLALALSFEEAIEFCARANRMNVISLLCPIHLETIDESEIN